MIKKVLFTVVFLLTFLSYGQEKKWSVETNYSIVPADGFLGGDIVINLGLKYRFLETNLLNLGVGIDGGYFTEFPFFVTSRNTNEVLFLFQPKLISEFNLPFSKTLKPTLGLGYSFFPEDL